MVLYNQYPSNDITTSLLQFIHKDHQFSSWIKSFDESNSLISQLKSMEVEIESLSEWQSKIKD